MDDPFPANFDRVARIYRWAEYLSLGPLLQQTRTYFLPQLRHCRSALVLGDGDGRFLARLMQQNSELRASAIDTSAAMLRLLSRNCENDCPNASQRLKTQRVSALDTIPSSDVDLITTHFFLDCLTQTEVDTLTQSYSEVVSPGALWLVSDFALPRNAFLRPIGALYIRSLYFAFRILTGLRVKRLPDPQTSLRNANFRRIARHDFLNGLIYTELWMHCDPAG